MRAVEYPADEFDATPVRFLTRLLRWTIALVLLVPCLAVSLLFTHQIMEGEVLKLLHQNSSSLPFIAGGASTLVLLTVGIFPSLFQRLYIFGHEATHALFVYLCFGEVRAFQVGEEGGYIIANRSNILVALAPYVFPFWTLVASAFYSLLGLVISNPLFNLSYFWVLGATWFFNLWWTIKMIPLGQSDLRENGTFLSLVIIYGVNMLTVSLLFEAASAQRNWTAWAYQLTNHCLDLMKIFF